jgi:hypothetical protein
VNEKDGEELKVVEVVGCRVGVSPPAGGRGTAGRSGEGGCWASGEKRGGFWAVMLMADSPSHLIYVRRMQFVVQ